MPYIIAFATIAAITGVAFRVVSTFGTLPF